MGSLTEGCRRGKGIRNVVAGLLLPPQVDSSLPRTSFRPRLLLVTRSTVFTRIFSHLITVSIPVYDLVGLSAPFLPRLACVSRWRVQDHSLQPR